jgi:hypothetical protein
VRAVLLSGGLAGVAGLCAAAVAVLRVAMTVLVAAICAGIVLAAGVFGFCL